jgi:ribosomal-protein-alanine N-acetyltransferase
MDLAGLPYSLDKMHLADLPTISFIERQVFATPWSIQAYRQEVLYHETASYLVLRYAGARPGGGGAWQRPWGARQDPTLLGYGGVWMILEEAHISTLAVRPEWREQGLGELLLAALIEQALEQAAETVTLEVRESNRAAQGLYVKYGFETVGLRKRYYPDNQEDALIMSTPPIQTAAYRTDYKARVEALVRRLRASPDVPKAEPGACHASLV